jgi:hypothetical protein
MTESLNPFFRGYTPTINKLNEITRILNATSNFIGDGVIRVHRTPFGYTISLSIPQLLSKIPKIEGEGVTWVLVVRGLSYPDPEESGDVGFDTYKLVPLSTLLYNNTTSYSVGTQVYKEDGEDTDVYTCKLACTGVAPPNGTYWTANTEIVPQAIGLEATYPATSGDMRDFSRWFYKGDIVPLYLRSGVYYFAQTMTPLVNSDNEGSLRWNEEEQRLMAVYR